MSIISVAIVLLKDDFLDSTDTKIFKKSNLQRLMAVAMPEKQNSFMLFAFTILDMLMQSSFRNRVE